MQMICGLLRGMRDALCVKGPVPKVDGPVGGQKHQVEDIDGQNPVDGPACELGADAGKVTDGDEHDELPARARRRAGLVVFVGVGGPGQAKADEHGGFEYLGYQGRSSSFKIGFSCLASLRRATTRCKCRLGVLLTLSIVRSGATTRRHMLVTSIFVRFSRLRSSVAQIVALAVWAMLTADKISSIAYATASKKLGFALQ